MARKKPELPPNEPDTRYTQDRFFWGISESLQKDLKEAWAQGEALSAVNLPDECLCAVTMLAAWGMRTDTQIVDDYDELIEIVQDRFNKSALHHPDLFFVSCICILHARAEEPTIGGFTQLGIPALFYNLIGRYIDDEETI